MELTCEFMSCREFTSKGKTFYMASFTSQQTGPFEMFLSLDQYKQCFVLTYLQSCILNLRLYTSNLRLSIGLDSIIL